MHIVNWLWSLWVQVVILVVFFRPTTGSEHHGARIGGTFETIFYLYNLRTSWFSISLSIWILLLNNLQHRFPCDSFCKHIKHCFRIFSTIKHVRCNLDVCPELMSRNQLIVQRGWLILIPHENKIDVISQINILFWGGGEFWSLMKMKLMLLARSAYWS